MFAGEVNTDKSASDDLAKARAYKNRLLNYDRTCTQRTKVIDDESDYYSVDANAWLSEKERKFLKKKEAEIREKRHGSRLNKKVQVQVVYQSKVNVSAIFNTFLKIFVKICNPFIHETLLHITTMKHFY